MLYSYTPIYTCTTYTYFTKIHVYIHSALGVQDSTPNFRKPTTDVCRRTLQRRVQELRQVRDRG